MKSILPLSDIQNALPDDFEALLADSLHDGHQFVQRLKDEWLPVPTGFPNPVSDW
jgi:hypothetical protein